MSYAIIDYYDAGILGGLKKNYNEEELTIYIPRFKEKKSKKYAKKVLKILDESNFKKIVLNKELVKNEVFCEELLNNKKEIVSGINMYKSIILRILRDVSNQMNVEIQKLKIVMLIEEYSSQNIDLIRTIAKEVKMLTIVTTDKNKFDLLIKQLFENSGIILKVVEKDVTNFENMNVLINVDFQSVNLNKYKMPNLSLIICGLSKNYELSQHFNGIIIKDIDIIDINNEKIEIDDLSLCEAKNYSYLRKLRENDRIFERNGCKINGYFGQNGKIRKEDFQKLGKNLLDK